MAENLVQKGGSNPKPRQITPWILSLLKMYFLSSKLVWSMDKYKEMNRGETDRQTDQDHIDGWLEVRFLASTFIRPLPRKPWSMLHVDNNTESYNM